MMKQLRALPSQFLWRTIEAILRSKHMALLYYREPDRSKIIDLVRTIKKESKMLLWEPEAYQIYMLVRSLVKIPGDIVEVGTYRGGSAKLIAEAEPNKEIHLFDTFTGLPEVSADLDASRFSTGQYATPLKNVQEYLKPYPRAHLYPGFFPETAVPIKEKKYSFVHLDVDIYQSTKDSLAFVYERMTPGGAILSHDYSTAEGVRKAFTEFFADKPEAVIELMSSQCLVIKK